jgi:hypothetical protein
LAHHNDGRKNRTKSIFKNLQFETYGKGLLMAIKLQKSDKSSLGTATSAFVSAKLDLIPQALTTEYCGPTA